MSEKTRTSQREIELIEKFFKDYRIGASINRQRSFVAGKSYVVFGVNLGPGTRIVAIENRLRELSELMSEHRGQPAPVRLRQMPLALELPHPAMEPIWLPASMKLAPHTMAMGTGFNFQGEEQKLIDLTKTPHILVAGTTGSGKSTLMATMLYSLLLNTDPADLRIMLIDLKNEDLLPFIDTPHNQFAAMSFERADQAIDLVLSEKEQRVADGKRAYQRLVLVIDELAELGQIKGARKRLASILAIGRSKHINVIAATQKPTAEVVGSTNKANFTRRLVGRVMSSDDAAVASSQPHCGAEFLPGNGSFLSIDGPNVERFQAYYTDDIEARMEAVRLRWYEQLSFMLPIKVGE